MRCTCPMGGDRTCPDDCATAIYWSMSDTERKAQRKTTAEKLYKLGFAMEQIARQLGVSHMTIVRDLKEFEHNVQTQPRTSKRGRKGEGRPKGSKSKGSRRGNAPVLDKARIIVREKIEAGKPVNAVKLQAEHGISHVTFETATAAELARNEALSDPEVTRSALESMTAKQKFDAAVKQMRRKLEVEIRKELHAEYHKWVQRQLDQYNENAKHYEIIIKARKGLMDKTAYNLIWSCLHADSRKSVSDERLNRAFNLWASLEKAILSEKDKPTTPSSLPKTVDELLKRREAYQAQRAAERAKKSKTGNAMAR